MFFFFPPPNHDTIKLPLSMAYLQGVYLCSLPKVQCKRVIKLKRKNSARTERNEGVGCKGERGSATVSWKMERE